MVHDKNIDLLPKILTCSKLLMVLTLLTLHSRHSLHSCH